MKINVLQFIYFVIGSRIIFVNHFVKHIIAGGKHVDIWKSTTCIYYTWLYPERRIYLHTIIMLIF